MFKCTFEDIVVLHRRDPSYAAYSGRNDCGALRRHTPSPPHFVIETPLLT